MTFNCENCKKATPNIYSTGDGQFFCTHCLKRLKYERYRNLLDADHELARFKSAKALKDKIAAQSVISPPNKKKPDTSGDNPD